MSVRNATAEWKGSLKEGSGTVRAGSGVFDGAYSFPSRFEDGEGTNPEELIAAAHAGCFSMALTAALGRAGFEPQSVQTEAKVTLEKTDDGPTITKIELTTHAQVPGIDEETLREHAEGAKSGCPVSRALAGTEIILSSVILGH